MKMMRPLLRARSLPPTLLPSLWLWLCSLAPALSLSLSLSARWPCPPITLSFSLSVPTLSSYHTHTQRAGPVLVAHTLSAC